jgi:DtxR family transcriptional regulator, Mn-dependent transcriptional regulator
MPSATVENYVKQLLMEEQKPGNRLVPMGRLARAMGVVPGTATTMIKALADSGIVDYEPRAGVRLTRGGRLLALHVMRRHRLVELFLVRVLGLDWSEVHREAEDLEHAISDKVLDRMDALLGHPRTDPHGDPIPTAKGQLRTDALASLADCPTRRSLHIARVLDQNDRFLKFAGKHDLLPGRKVTVEQRDPAADSIVVRNRKGTATLGASAAGKILVSV